jgi:transcriptional regulator with XRE-family HTH domain
MLPRPVRLRNSRSHAVRALWTKREFVHTLWTGSLQQLPRPCYSAPVTQDHFQAGTHQTLRRHLAQEFERRCRENPRYSLRAFARSLGVDSSYLSKLLNDRRTLSRKALQGFASRLNVPLAQKPPVATGRARQPAFEPVSADQFRLIADWHHYAILELTRTDDFRPDLRWIARALGVPHGEVFAAVERLRRMGLLETAEDGSWSCARNNTTTAHAPSTIALRHLQAQILEQAKAALVEVPIERRDQSSITMAVDARRLPEAKRRIREFRRELMEFLEGGSSKHAVYQLSVSLFPVSHRKKERVSHA